MTGNLFDEPPTPYDTPQVMAPGAVLLRGFACDEAEALIQAAEQVYYQPSQSSTAAAVRWFMCHAVSA